MHKSRLEIKNYKSQRSLEKTGILITNNGYDVEMMENAFNSLKKKR